jgi:hypothetical protein
MADEERDGLEYGRFVGQLTSEHMKVVVRDAWDRVTGALTSFCRGDCGADKPRTLGRRAVRA